MQPLGKFLIYFPFLLFTSPFEELTRRRFAPTATPSYARDLIEVPAFRLLANV